MTWPERPVAFSCEGAELIGILHEVPKPADVVVVIVVGGPQYRIGSHRLFVHLARALAASGIPVFRFDYRGLGDSEGDLLGFENIDADIKAGVDVACAEAGVASVVLWGLCDAASAATFYGYSDARVSGLVLANPWVRTAQGESRTYVKKYYFQRLMSSEFWKKILNNNLDYRTALKDYMRNLSNAFSRPAPSDQNLSNPENLPARVEQAFFRFHGPILILLSGNDLTAHEFSDLMRSKSWQKKLRKLKGYTAIQVPNADHTFSRPGNEANLQNATIEWITSSVIRS